MAQRTFDQMALDILLGGGSQRDRQAQLKSLKAHARGKVECPDCGDMGPHDDNGCTGLDRSYCCNKCGTHFDAHEV